MPKDGGYLAEDEGIRGADGPVTYGTRDRVGVRRERTHDGAYNGANRAKGKGRGGNGFFMGDRHRRGSANCARTAVGGRVVIRTGIGHVNILFNVGRGGVMKDRCARA